MDLFWRFIEENFGLAFTIGVIVVSAVLSGIIWLAIWCFKVISKNKELEKQITGLPCSEHKDSINKHADQYEKIFSSLSRISGQVDLIVQMTFQPTPKVLEDASMFSEKRSPRKLNGNGEMLYKNIKGDNFLDANELLLLSEIEKLHPTTALDVESFSLYVLYANSNKPIFNELKNWVYNSSAIDIQSKDGEYTKKEISFDDVLFVLSIPLRDRYLSKHSEINADIE